MAATRAGVSGVSIVTTTWTVLPEVKYEAMNCPAATNNRSEGTWADLGGIL